ncbi:hypothetical protein FRC20_002394 [Serendipita sp. 405]|nr:hypothetical protein FRC20_002394 [Serendipita sp. 405]
MSSAGPSTLELNIQLATRPWQPWKKNPDSTLFYSVPKDLSAGTLQSCPICPPIDGINAGMCPKTESQSESRRDAKNQWCQNKLHLFLYSSVPTTPRGAGFTGTVLSGSTVPGPKCCEDKCGRKLRSIRCTTNRCAAHCALVEAMNTLSTEVASTCPVHLETYREKLRELQLVRSSSAISTRMTRSSASSASATSEPRAAAPDPQPLRHKQQQKRSVSSIKPPAIKKSKNPALSFKPSSNGLNIASDSAMLTPRSNLAQPTALSVSKYGEGLFDNSPIAAKLQRDALARARSESTQLDDLNARKVTVYTWLSPTPEELKNPIEANVFLALRVPQSDSMIISNNKNLHSFLMRNSPAHGGMTFFSWRASQWIHADDKMPLALDGRDKLLIKTHGVGDQYCLQLSTLLQDGTWDTRSTPKRRPSVDTNKTPRPSKRVHAENSTRQPRRFIEDSSSNNEDDAMTGNGNWSWWGDILAKDAITGINAIIEDKGKDGLDAKFARAFPKESFPMAAYTRQTLERNRRLIQQFSAEAISEWLTENSDRTWREFCGVFKSKPTVNRSARKQPVSLMVKSEKVSPPSLPHPRSPRRASLLQRLLDSEGESEALNPPPSNDTDSNSINSPAPNDGFSDGLSDDFQDTIARCHQFGCPFCDSGFPPYPSTKLLGLART